MTATVITESAIDFAAGLFEGEGTVSIAIRKSDETYRLIVSMTSTDRDLIDFLRERWGGWVYEHASRGPRRQFWNWMASGPTAEAVVRTLAPHVRSRRVRDRFDVALEFRDLQLDWARRWLSPAYKAEQRRLYAEMRVLNRRGTSVAEVA